MKAAMNMTVLISGGFGFAGHYLIYGLLKQGYHVILIGRRKQSRVILQRLEILAETNALVNPEFRVEPDAFKKLTLLEGDISEDCFGLSNADFNYLKQTQIDAIHNLAAYLRYEKKYREECWRTNVRGTRQLLDLACDKNCRYIHASTAYIAGSNVPSGELIEEKFYEHSVHPNVYLESKSTAEALIKTYSNTHNLDYLILRLPTLIGDSKTGFTNSEFGFYEYLGALDTLRRKTNNKRLIRFKASPEGTVNIVPVDIVMKCYLEICKHKCNPRIYNITDNNPMSPGELGEVMGHLFDIPLKADKSTVIGKTGTRDEKLFARLTCNNSAFAEHIYKFDSSNSERCLGHPVTDGWEKTEEYFRLLIEGFRKHRLSRRVLTLA